MKILINDNLIDSSDAKINVLDLGLNRGYAVFDYFKIVNSHFRFFEDHLDRFLVSIELSKIPFVYSREEVKEKIVSLKDINKIENGFVRITLTAGNSDNYSRISSHSNLIIVVGSSPMNEGDKLKSGVKLISKYFQRGIPKIKTTDYFFAQMHQSEMIESGAVDILYYTDTITETSRANIFFVKSGKLFTPQSNILEGITRKKVLSMYGNTQIADISMEEINSFDEAFICSSTREITPVVSIDDIIIGSGKVGAKTTEVYQNFKLLL